MLKDFLTFIKKGNVLDLAVAAIIGRVFGAIATSLVEDIIMPIIGAILQGIDFTNLSLTFGEAVIAYGNFIQSVVNFLVVAFVIFSLIRFIKKLRKEQEEAPQELLPSPEEKLLTEIRDILKNSHKH